MKNNKGFTLVELLAVIVILAILVTIAVPSTIGISNKLKENMFCKKIDSIEVAAKFYGEDRKSSFDQQYLCGYEDKEKTKPIQCSSTTISVQALINSGDLKKDNNVCGGDNSPCIVDPRDNSGLDAMELTIYEKYNRIYVAFNDTIKKTCDK